MPLTREQKILKKGINEQTMVPGAVWSRTEKGRNGGEIIYNHLTHIFQYRGPIKIGYNHNIEGRTIGYWFICPNGAGLTFVDERMWTKKVVENQLTCTHVDKQKVRFFNAPVGQLPLELPAINSVWNARDGRQIQINEWIKPESYPYRDYIAKCTTLNPKQGQHVNTSIEFYSFGRRLVAQTITQQRLDELQSLDDDSNFIMKL